MKAIRIQRKKGKTPSSKPPLTVTEKKGVAGSIKYLLSTGIKIQEVDRYLIGVSRQEVERIIADFKISSYKWE